MFDIQDELKKLPDLPGVYMMKNSAGKIIYIGKARILKNRVKQYFTGSNHDIKTEVLVERIKSFDYIVTDSEVEALILESTLIKKHMPHYNILLKDDKSFPYIRVDVENIYPTITVERRPADDNAKYFGPFHVSATTLNQMLSMLKKVFPIRSCDKNFDRIDNMRPCLNYHIKKCSGVCTGNVTKERYRVYVKNIMDFFNGKHEEIVKDFENQMAEASENLDFENAAVIRDKISLIRSVTEKQKIVSVNHEDIDYVAVYSEYDMCCIGILYVRDGKLSEKREFIQKNVLGEPAGEILSSFMKQYYTAKTLVPKTVVTNVEPVESDLISRWLSESAGKNVSIHVPQKGRKKELSDMAAQNAMIYLKNYCLRQNNIHMIAEQGLYGLKEVLGLEELPGRIEAYDISNTGSSNIVAGRIVFINGKKDTGSYRRYKIKSTEKQDDYASMAEVVWRRLKGEKDLENLPDVILLDGGKGHVTAVSKVLEEFTYDIVIAGMVKDDKHKTKGLITGCGELDLTGNGVLLRFLSGIQEEVHRYAIAYNRLLAGKTMRESVLDDIPGIGPKRKKDLIAHFQSVDNIKKASMCELVNVKGISESTAKVIFNYFHNCVE